MSAKLVKRLRLWGEHGLTNTLSNLVEAADTIEAQAAEMIEQARIIGMGAERELALRAEIERLRGLVKDALEKGRHRLLKEGFSPQDPTVRAMNEAIRALAQQEPTP